MSVDSNTGSNFYTRMNPSANPVATTTVQPPVLLGGTAGQPPQGVLTISIQTNSATMLTNSAATNEKPYTVIYNQRPAIDGIIDFAVKMYKSYCDQCCKRCYENYNVDPEG